MYVVVRNKNWGNEGVRSFSSLAGQGRSSGLNLGSGVLTLRLLAGLHGPGALP